MRQTLLQLTNPLRLHACKYLEALIEQIKFIQYCFRHQGPL